MFSMVQKNQAFGLICLISLALFYPPADSCAEEKLPPMPSGSYFGDQIDLESYPSIPAPENAPLIRWDFSDNKVYPFDFVQKIIAQNEMDDMSDKEKRHVSEQNVECHGKLSLKSEGNNIARMVIEDLTMNVEIDIQDNEDPKVMKSKAPPVVMQGIKEDGSMEIGNSSQELLFKTLFPIPPSPLKIGESVSIPAQMPFNAMGSLLHVSGKSRIKVVDYVQISGKTCVKLETAIDISTLKVPEEMEGNYGCKLKGNSVFYFNLEDRHFMSGRVALFMSTRIEAPALAMEPAQEIDKEKMPEMIRMAMDSDNFLSVEYIGN